ncbi:MAG: 2,3-bisphosphoglycerate-independent phosphoglycerate mutase [Pseudomonadota bacterium]|nr:2,3-bisphosphoglycerate-independent phosphoglycerate mutase [Pseudomonadota bacterium]
MTDQVGVSRRPVVLVILDGFGINPSKINNAIAEARTPRLDEYFFRYPFTMLSASGPGVGLPEGQMGNSEVGHITLGSGSTVRQDLVLIGDAIADGSFFRNRVLSEAIDSAVARGRPVHLLGLVSDGGVHSHVSHLFALLELCVQRGARPLVHMITDGRDTPPRSALHGLEELKENLAAAGGEIATLSGRYYAMDRDRRWDRTERAWRAIVLGRGRNAANAGAAIQTAYATGKGDEFINPTVIGGYQGLGADDVLISFNFRKDRPRQIVAAVGDPEFDGFDRGEPRLADVSCMMEYERRLGLPFAFSPEAPSVTLNSILSTQGIGQLHCAETEKYAHVTYFFNGGRQELLAGEEHRLIPSPQVATYDLAPAMSAPAVADEVVKAVGEGRFGFIVVNFANGDMVGHTGDMRAAVQAVEALDREVGRVLDVAVGAGYSVLLTADHGNCDLMVDPETDEPHTQHTTNPVPLLVVDETRWVLAAGGLADVAPTVLQLMGMEPPQAMSGRSVLVKPLPSKPVPALERLNAA